MLIFYIFEPGDAYKKNAYKKSVYATLMRDKVSNNDASYIR